MDILKDGIKNLGYSLNEIQLEQFESFYRELLDWNQRMNLTSITKYADVQSKHFLDSLLIFSGFDAKTDIRGLRLLDVGTGAGLPGIPMKICYPEIHLSLLESTIKKTEFLKYIISVLDLKDVEILPGRAEELARIDKHREKYDIVTSRAVAPLASLVELTLPFCVIGGRCILPKKGDLKREVDEAEKAIEILGGKLVEVKNVGIPGLDDNRQLVIIDKIAPVPDKYPRRPGMPEKRPIR